MRPRSQLRLASASNDAAEKSSAAPAIHIIQPVQDAIQSFPSTRYYGSKRKLLRSIYAHIRGIQFESALDAFGGTGSVSLLLKAMRKKVTYHDGLAFNHDIGKTVLADETALTRAAVQAFITKIKPRTAVISRNFDGIFYTKSENRWLDGFIGLLNESSYTDDQAALLRYLVYQACLKKRPFNLFHRANLHLRLTCDIPRTFGNAVTWEKSFKHHMLQAYDELQRTIKPFNSPYQILPPGNAEDVSPGYDLVYIDPPYISPQDRYNYDDYWRRYHFLEGLAQYDQWESRISLKSKTREFAAPIWLTEWSRSRTFKDKLFAFINKHRSSIVVLSYVTNAHPTESEIKEYFESKFADVSIHSSKYNHALSRSPKRELLFIGHPRT